MAEIKIAVDAMGSDQAPGVEVDGAVQAAAEYGIPIVLVGREDRVHDQLRRHDTANLAIEVVHASEVITMEESAATAARKKRDSSIRVAARLMRDAGISGIVSAGNTGAVMASVKMVLGTLPVVDRPALSTVLPTQKGKPAILLDVGANVDCNRITWSNSRSWATSIHARFSAFGGRAWVCCRSVKKTQRETS